MRPMNNSRKRIKQTRKKSVFVDYLAKEELPDKIIEYRRMRELARERDDFALVQHCTGMIKQIKQRMEEEKG